MRITYKTFTLIPTQVGRFDLVNNEVYFSKKQQSTGMGEKCHGYDMTLDTCIKKMINIELEQCQDVTTLKEYLSEFKRLKGELDSYLKEVY